MPKLTLNRVFAISLIGLIGGLALLFWLGFHGLQTALLRSADSARDHDGAVIAQSVSDYLGQAPAAASQFESLLRAGLIQPADPQSLRNGLLSVLLGNAEMSEATFTYAKSRGFDARGHSIIDPGSVGQLTLLRTRDGAGLILRTTVQRDGKFYSTRQRLSLDGSEGPPDAPVEVPDPAAHPTFVGPAIRRLYGTLLWTDVHWAAVDPTRAKPDRGVEVSVLKAVESPPGKFAGVLRIGLFKDRIDAAIAMPKAVDVSSESIFLCDDEGRLIAIPGSKGYVEIDDDLRIPAEDAPPQVQEALRRPRLASVDADHPSADDQFTSAGTVYLCTFRSLPHTQDWIVGLVVPRRAYLGDLLEIRGKVLWGSLGLTCVIALLGVVVLKAVSVAHAVILREAALMNDFILTRSQNSCRFDDINRVLGSLERAKTAMRAMGKYVPMDLVRRLYHRGEEPRLGGHATELCTLFTDIQGFTEFAESEEAGIVANRLGQYLEVMVAIIQREKGTIDKFIGDSVMAFWNAPEPVPDNAALACRAVLDCRKALAELYASPEWQGAPGFETRFGMHRSVASVGHFGAPDRFNYTAIGDGINLASRLERLNKHYGTAVIVSATVKESAGAGFLFRRLDRVAVKGKTQVLDIYELIGDAGAGVPEFVAVYEQALEAWFQGEFAQALRLAEAQPGDPPSVFLASRCRAFLTDPPAGWSGVYIFETK
jgi:adenylate cyclase